MEIIHVYVKVYGHIYMSTGYIMGRGGGACAYNPTPPMAHWVFIAVCYNLAHSSRIAVFQYYLVLLPKVIILKGQNCKI